jgi:hypothetical protein
VERAQAAQAVEPGVVESVVAAEAPGELEGQAAGLAEVALPVPGPYFDGRSADGHFDDQPAAAE